MVRKHVACCSDAYAACDGAAAVLILTKWDEFRTDSMMLFLGPSLTSLTAQTSLQCKGPAQVTVLWRIQVEVVQAPMVIITLLRTLHLQEPAVQVSFHQTGR
jgi:hypothetical protein